MKSAIVALLFAVILGGIAFRAVSDVRREYVPLPPLPAASMPEFHETLPSPAAPLVLLFGGDVMLDRSVRQAVDARGGATTWITEGIRQVFRGVDATVFNLEGPITDHPSRSVGTAVGSRDNYLFTFAPSTVRSFLADLPHPTPSIGNNHAIDRGAAGIGSTVAFLEGEAMPFFGAIGEDIARTVTVGGIDGRPCVTVVNYNQFLGSPAVAATATTVSDAAAGPCAVVVYAHWGQEYTNRLLPSLQDAARAFIDAGAVAVFGAHAHVVGPVEVYRDRAIFYSLGNLVFDQWWNDEVREGVLVAMRLDDDEITYVITPIAASRIALAVADTATRDRVIGRMLAYAALPEASRSTMTKELTITLPR